MHIVELCILAFIAMVLQDILGVAQTQANARDRAQLSGFLDMVSWLVALYTTFISLDALNGHDLVLKISVIVSVSVANYVGSVLGVKLGQKYIKAVAPVVVPGAEKRPPHKER